MSGNTHTLADRFKVYLPDAIGCGLQGHPCPER
jgi:hypothetical protein